MTKPCRLWTEPDAVLAPRWSLRRVRRPIGDGSHMQREPLHGGGCGRLDDREWSEEIGRAGGHDFRSVDPVPDRDEDDACHLGRGLMVAPHLRHDAASAGERITSWIGDPSPGPWRRGATS